MCTRKIEIKINLKQDNQLIWKMPKQLQEYYKENKAPKMLVKCGKCWECKNERARNWIFKLWLEAKEHEKQCFITLTLKNTKTEKGKNLNKNDLQNFIKRLRKNENIKDLKYFAAGEYGEKKGRAHYHIIMLGYLPNDLIKDNKFYSKKGNEIYRSPKLEKIWGKGVVTVQAFHKDEIPYLTLYLDNNSTINNKINWYENKLKKEKLTELHIKYGIKTRVKNNVKKIKNIKDLTNEEYKQYKLSLIHI